MKERIIKGFIEEAQKKNIKFTMDDLAENLGISKRTIYEHFSSKKEILETIIQRSFDGIKNKEKEIIERNDLKTVEKIQAVMTIVPKYFDLYDREILVQMKKYYPEQWEQVTFELNNTWNNLRDLLSQGIEEGVIKNFNLSIVMKLISSGINWFNNRHFLIQNNINSEEAYSTIADILLFGLTNESHPK
ncbi:TetR/AcrR family transcriptional regulator [Terrilactibacillus sp. S3-3]|nr:TetR/AcrR family transcriptional regulator [Terrilactibacillus sp. S3-3]